MSLFLAERNEIAPQIEKWKKTTSYDKYGINLKFLKSGGIMGLASYGISRIIHTLKLGKISVRTHWCKLSQIPLSQVNSAWHKDKKREEVIRRSHPFVYTLHFSTAFLITVLPSKVILCRGLKKLCSCKSLIFHSCRIRTLLVFTF